MTEVDALHGQEISTAFDAGVSEANQRENSEFDGLLGQLDKGTSIVLQDILSDLRSQLLDKYSEADARRLLREYEPRPGYRNLTPIPDDVELALRLLNNIRSALRCSDDDPNMPDRFTNLIFGKVGVKIKKRIRGSSKGGLASAKARSGPESKREQIIAAGKLYAGSITSRAANIAKKVGATPQHVRRVLDEKGI